MQGNVSFVYEVRQSLLLLAICKRWISHQLFVKLTYKLFVNIFHEFDLFYYISHDYEISGYL